MSFDLFWVEYPRKVSKGAAITSYKKAIKSVDHGTIMEGLRAYNSHLEEHPRERNFIKHPSTWLNQMCWADEHVERLTTHQQIEADEAKRRLIARYEKDPEYWDGRISDGTKRMLKIGPYAEGVS